MTGSVRVVPAVPNDAPLVHAITQAAFAEQATLDPPSSALVESEEDVARAIAAGGAVLAWDGSVAVATARFELAAHHLYVGRLAVLPGQRRLGLGAALMAYLEVEARRRGLPEVRVGVRRALPCNVAFFERLGFQVIAEQPHPKQPTATTLTLAKEVRPR